MQDIWVRFATDMVARIEGPMNLRLLMQPIMALTFATMAGLRDARTGRPPYFWTVLTQPGLRRAMATDGWTDVGKVFAVALVLDAVYQFIVERFVYPGEAVAVALALAIVPYVVVRGLVTRIARPRGSNCS